MLKKNLLYLCFLNYILYGKISVLKKVRISPLNKWVEFLVLKSNKNNNKKQNKELLKVSSQVIVNTIKYYSKRYFDIILMFKILKASLTRF